MTKHGWAFPAMVFALCVVRSDLAAAQTAAATEISQVRAAGMAKRGLRPDLATLTVQFTATAGSPAAAGRLVALKADSLRRAFSASGIPRDSLLSGSRWYWWRGRVEVLPSSHFVERPATQTSRPGSTQVFDTTYRVSDAIEVHVRDMARVGSVMDSALAHGVTEISQVRFSATATPAIQDSITREATKTAMRQAEAMAGASGKRLGRLLSLSTQPDYRYDRDLFDSVVLNSSSSGYDSGATAVVQPSIPVSITVYGRWGVLP